MKKKVLMASVATFFAAGVFAATPTVENVRLEGGGLRTVVTYDLVGAPGIVTLEIQTNTVTDLTGDWVAIDGQLLRTVEGDVSCLVQPGKNHRITWRGSEALGENAPLEKARAVVTAWTTNAPPDYLVADLSGKDVVRYYTSTNYFPFGFGHLTYKTTNIVYRLVHAKGRTFTAGEYSAYINKDTNTDNCINEGAVGNPHVVNMTRNYYLAIYETTCAQYHFATGCGAPYPCGIWPAGMNYELATPCGVMWRNNMRGNNQWPTDGYRVDGTDNFVGGARDKTGLLIDLPTEAEWEFAARCGGLRPINKQIVNGEPIENVVNVANVGHVNDGKPLLEVGSLLPNDWGFYDMLGNAAEMCLDWVYVDTTTGALATIDEETTDPIGLTAGGNSYVFRGGRYQDWYAYSTGRATTYQTGSWHPEGQNGYGFRTVVVIEPHDFTANK